MVSVASVRALVRTLLVVVALDATTVASAQPNGSVDAEARGLFHAGNAAFDDGRFEDAFGYFSRSYELSRRPELLFNLASACERLRRDADAIDFYRRYLEALPDAYNHAFVEGRLAFLRRTATPAPAPVASDPPPVEAAVDPAPPETVPAPAAEPVRVPMPADAASAAPDVAPSSGPLDQGAPVDRARSRTRRIVLWTVAAVVVAGAVTTGLVVGLRDDPIQDPLRGDVGPRGIIVALFGGGS